MSSQKQKRRKRIDELVRDSNRCARADEDTFDKVRQQKKRTTKREVK